MPNIKHASTVAWEVAKCCVSEGGIDSAGSVYPVIDATSDSKWAYQSNKSSCYRLRLVLLLNHSVGVSVLGKPYLFLKSTVSHYRSA